MNDLMRHRGEFARAIANRKFEFSPAGILFPQQKCFVGGVFDTEFRRGGDLFAHDISPNIVPTEGLNHLLDVLAGGAAQVNPWYVGLFKGNVTPGLTLTGATFDLVCTEATEYDETTRQTYVEAAAADGIMSNGASRAVFTINAGITVYGGALLSVSAKQDATVGSKCLAASKFSTARAVVDDDELAVKYTLTATST